jgi:hypothetical protein
MSASLVTNDSVVMSFAVGCVVMFIVILFAPKELPAARVYRVAADIGQVVSKVGYRCAAMSAVPTGGTANHGTCEHVLHSDRAYDFGVAETKFCVKAIHSPVGRIQLNSAGSSS